MWDPRPIVLHEHVFSSTCKVVVVCFVHQGEGEIFSLINDPDCG
jgi:hypothetical protein